MLGVGQSGTRELSGGEEVEPAQKSAARIFALEIIGGIEKPLPSGLALTARQRPKGVEAPRDRAGEAELALAIGRDAPVQWVRCLVRSVRPTQSLDRALGTPARPESSVYPFLLVPRVVRSRVDPSRSRPLLVEQDPF